MLKNWRKQFQTPAKVPRRRKFIQVETARQTAPIFQQPLAEVVVVCGTRVIFYQVVDTSILQAFNEIDAGAVTFLPVLSIYTAGYY